jgi:hypothetical protein
VSRIRLIKHESVPQTGSYEVRFPDGRPSVYHYFDDNPGRRSITDKMTSEEALQAAKALARAEQDRRTSCGRERSRAKPPRPPGKGG